MSEFICVKCGEPFHHHSSKRVWNCPKCRVRPLILGRYSKKTSLPDLLGERSNFIEKPEVNGKTLDDTEEL